MHPRNNPTEAVLGLLREQAGVISREQALGNGLTRESLRRLVREARWHMLTSGIYCRDDEPRWMSLAWAGLLLGGEHSAIGGEAALHLYGVVKDPPDVIDVWIPPKLRRRRRIGPWEFRRGTRAARGSLSKTSVEDAVLDAAVNLPEGDVIARVGDALTLKRTTHSKLLGSLSRRGRHPQRRLLLELLNGSASGVRSSLEFRYLRDVERAHGLPRAKRQASHVRSSQVDNTYECYSTVVELDGRTHAESGQRFKDMARDNAHAVMGMPTLRYGWFDVVGRPCEVARQVAGVLTSRGWEGFFQPCPACPQ